MNQSRIHAHDHPFDPTHGYDLGELLAIQPPPAPPDFDAFWLRTYDCAREVDVAPQVGALTATYQETRVFDVSYTTLGGLRLGGWLVLPDGPVERGLVVGHGYGGRTAPGLPLPLAGTAAIFPCARGLGARSRVDGIPDVSARHVLHGIQTRDRYVHRGCVADVWCAASALLRLVPSVAGRLGYLGVSFGGGIGALALPWDDRFTAAHLTLPSFGHHPLRLTMPCTGSGEAIRRHHAAHPEVLDVLRYFDAATAATRITIPVQVAAARFDPAVPPPGQFAIHNALSGPRGLVVLSTGHPGTAADEQALLAAQSDFLAAHQ
ncbi:acetylxylan esterase [Polymorphospora rubra]|uniref:Deacetylase n=1 Tax=Polymorphospora rubra TaxID=338584 RepID=A0A810N8U6_9ACTN|nr:acetylxylan esterase [Polymorphospora rubra]BCJ69460.1 deacetylase [Polymorphospora rubra]